MSKMLGKSGRVSFRPNCNCCNLSEDHRMHKSESRRIKRSREKKLWQNEARNT